MSMPSCQVWRGGSRTGFVVIVALAGLAACGSNDDQQGLRAPGDQRTVEAAAFPTVKTTNDLTWRALPTEASKGLDMNAVFTRAAAESVADVSTGTAVQGQLGAYGEAATPTWRFLVTSMNVSRARPSWGAGATCDWTMYVTAATSELVLEQSACTAEQAKTIKRVS